MSSSDEEGEIAPDFVNYYWFENDKGGFVPLTSFRLLWSISEAKCGSETKIFLRGTTDDGLQKIHKQIIGWRFELPYSQPEISVLLKDNRNWITLERPRKCFEIIIRAVLVTITWLHHVKWNPEEPRVSIWNKIMKEFSSFDVTPSENDVLNHVWLIREAAERDKDLTKSKYLLNFIEKASSNEGFHVDVLAAKKPKFIVDSEEEKENDKSDGELNSDDGQNILMKADDVPAAKKPKFIVDSEEEKENDRSDGELNSEDGQNILMDVLAAKKPKFIVDSEEEKESDKSDGELNSNDGQNILMKDVHAAKKSKLIVDSEEEEEENDKSDGELNGDEGQNIGYDTACAICDNGGEILPCEGRCLRSFHATKEAGIDTLCESLGYTAAQVNALPNFYCENCKFKQHQCFACGKLASSDVSSNPEVFPCINANCGQYYHPECVAKLLCPDNDTEQQEMSKGVAFGKAFICPLHRCFLCRKGENRNVHDLQFAMCRRCPKAYHRKCLPREISFTPDYYMGIEQRAWDGLLDHRILMYCMDHEIVKELATPARDHLVFPYMEVNSKMRSYKLLSKERDATILRQSFEDLPPKRSLATDLVTKESVSIQNNSSAKIRIKKDRCLSTGSFKFDVPRKHLKDEKMFVSNRPLPSIESNLSVRKDNPYSSSRLLQASSQQQKMVSGRIERSLDKPLKKKVKISPDFAKADLEKGILSLVEESTSAFNEEQLRKNHQGFSTSSCFTETVLDKNLTQGKIEGSVKAIQTALQMLEEGCSIDEAKAICEPGILHRLFFWQKQLKVYLAPFLHGMRYTSFGRHFTKIDKLKEVVDRLHWYVQNGDTVLDFCCGSNDFSCLMKSKLEQMGKSCSFKNYDLFQPKNDSDFERRDWMTVNAEELPNGSQLIIGLNPPFGVKGFLANKFIEKALTFKPKLLVLIVPKVTKRLDGKKGRYDLIWEDDEMLSGKSFYLPGSVDTRDKQLEDWNLKPPPLYLWSRPDWTGRHREIALSHCHIKEKYNQRAKGKDVKNYLMEENHDCYQDYSGMLHAPDDFLSILDGVPDDNGGNTTTPEEGLGQMKSTAFPAVAEESCSDMELSTP